MISPDRSSFSSSSPSISNRGWQRADGPARILPCYLGGPGVAVEGSLPFILRPSRREGERHPGNPQPLRSVGRVNVALLFRKTGELGGKSSTDH